MKIQIDQAQNPSHLFQGSKDSVCILMMHELFLAGKQK